MIEKIITSIRNIIFSIKIFYIFKFSKKAKIIPNIKNLSPSRASQFKTCPRQFKFSNIDKIKEPTNEVQAKGTTVHQALEDLFDLPSHERDINNLHNLFRKAWTKVRNNDDHYNLFDTVEEERKWGLDGLKLLNNYMSIEDPQSFEPLERERWVRGSIDDLNLRGILDRMDRNKNGKLVIVDYKSGKAPQPKYKNERFFALKLYALLIKEETNELPSELKLIYLKNSTIHTLKIEESDLKDSRTEILKIWNDIKNSVNENDFPTIPNKLCDWCYYKPICPEFNELPPNTDRLRIINREIDENKEQLDAVSMFKETSDLPENIKSINKHKVKRYLNFLETKKDKIEKEITTLL